MAKTQQNINRNTHNNIFNYLYTDELLNEFLWRADPSTKCLVNDINNALITSKINPSNNIIVQIQVFNNGMYINIYQNNTTNKIGHVSLHLLNGPSVGSGKLHIKNNKTDTYQLLHLTKSTNMITSPYIDIKLSSLYSFLHTPYINFLLRDVCETIIQVLNQYFSPKLNPMSLYNKICSVGKPHRTIMPIIRTRPTILRTTLTSSLKGGKVLSSIKRIKRKTVSKKYRLK